jgi:hypothetical protein
MSPNLLRGTSKSIGGDLDVDDEGSEQHRFKPVQSLHHVLKDRLRLSDQPIEQGMHIRGYSEAR